jgi:magnesium transporter
MNLPNLPRISLTSKAKMRAGLPPGTLIHVGQKKTEKTDIELIQYDTQDLEKYSSTDVTEILSKLDSQKRNWINVDGLHNIESIQQIGEHFKLSHLLLEDVLNTEQRPKLDEYDGQLFLPLKALNTVRENVIEYEQISLVLGKDFLISFQEKEGDMFDGLRERIKVPTNRLRQKKVDYLFYRLIDTIVDNYYVVMENLGTRIEDIEEEVYLDPKQSTLNKIQDVKKELIFIRKSIYPIREAIAQLMRNDYTAISESTRKYLNDVYDHTIQIIDTYETYRDLTSNLMDMYMTTISHRLNEVMKVLTVISTIFIPLTFLAGVYGMNFHYMPELTWRYGYFVVLGIMGVMVVIMISFFKRKGWF